MTRDEMQTAACNRVTSLVDGILWAVSQIRDTGPGNDSVTDLLDAIRADAGRAMAINHRICFDDLDEALARGHTSSVEWYK